MAKDKRLFIGGVDKDSDYRVVQPNDYVDATNIRNVLSNTGNAAGAVENIKGNTLVPFTFPLREPAQPQKTNLVVYGDEPSSGTEDLTVNIIVGSNTATSVETINYSNSTPLFTALSTIRTELISSMASNSISGITISTPTIESDSIGFSSGFASFFIFIFLPPIVVSLFTFILTPLSLSVTVSLGCSLIFFIKSAFFNPLVVIFTSLLYLEIIFLISAILKSSSLTIMLYNLYNIIIFKMKQND